MQAVSENVQELTNQNESLLQANQNVLDRNKTLTRELTVKNQRINNLEENLHQQSLYCENLRQNNNTVQSLLDSKDKEITNKIQILHFSNHNQNDLLVKLKIAEWECGKLATNILALERQKQFTCDELNEAKMKLALLIEKYEDDVNSSHNELKYQQNSLKITEQELIYAQEKIQRLNNDKNEMFAEYQRLQLDFENKVQELQTENLRIHNLNKTLVRHQKIGFLTKGLKWTTFWFMNPQQHKMFKQL